MSVCDVKWNKMNPDEAIFQRGGRSIGSIVALNGRQGININDLADLIAGRKTKPTQQFKAEVHFRQGPDALILMVRYGDEGGIKQAVDVAKLTGQDIATPETLIPALRKLTGAKPRRAPRRGAGQIPSVR